MNCSEIPTVEKIMLPVRLPPELYKKLRNKVNQGKNQKRGYSINEYLTELIRKDLEGEK